MEFLKNFGGATGRLAKATASQYFDLDEDRARFTIKPAPLTYLLQVAREKAGDAVSSIELKDDHIEVALRRSGIDIRLLLTCEQVCVRGEQAVVRLSMVAPPEATGSSFFGSVAVLIWRLLFGGRIDRLSLPESLEVEGQVVTWTTDAADLELLPLLVGKGSDGTVIDVDLTDRQLSLSAVEPASFQPNWVGLVAFALARMGKSDS